MKTLTAGNLSLSHPSGNVVTDLTVEVPVGGIPTIIGPRRPPAGDVAVAHMRTLFADLAPGGLISEEDSTGWYRS